jgi:hypothetical protein
MSILDEKKTVQKRIEKIFIWPDPFYWFF